MIDGPGQYHRGIRASRPLRAEGSEQGPTSVSEAIAEGRAASSTSAGGAPRFTPKPPPLTSPKPTADGASDPAVGELPPLRSAGDGTDTRRDDLDDERQAQIEAATIKVRGSRTITDLSTPSGMGLAFLFLVLAILLGGAPLAFINLPAALIVIGGVVAVTIASFSLTDLRALWPVIRRTVSYRYRRPQSAALHVLELADYARHNGILKLQGVAHDSTYNEPLLFEGLQHIIDSMPADPVIQAMRQQSQARSYRHGQAANILRRAAEVAPAMGLIGTLIGLVQMLSSLHDPSEIGPGMAMALLTTLYGACLGHLALGPLAAKLERLSHAEDLLDEIYIHAVASIGRKENPRRLELSLNSILPPPERVQFYD